MKNCFKDWSQSKPMWKVLTFCFAYNAWVWIFSLLWQELKDVHKLLSERDFELRQLKKEREEEQASLVSKFLTDTG